MSGQKPDQGGLVGSFQHLDSLLEAIAAVRQAGHIDFEVFSPVSNHELEHVLNRPRSRVRLFTFTGAGLGLLFGFGLAISTSLVWNLIVGGKPVVSLPPFLVVGFELTILFGALATLWAVLRMAGLPRRLSPGYHPRFSDDRFGLFVHLSEDQGRAVRRLLEVHHAESTWWVGEGRP